MNGEQRGAGNERMSGAVQLELNKTRDLDTLYLVVGFVALHAAC